MAKSKLQSRIKHLEEKYNIESQKDRSRIIWELMAPAREALRQAMERQGIKPLERLPMENPEFEKKWEGTPIGQRPLIDREKFEKALQKIRGG